MAVHTAHYGAHAEPAQSQWWQFGLLGVALVAIGIFLLANVVAATIATAILFGVALLLVGLFEVLHAFWAKGWGGFFVSLIVGLLYMGAGAVLLYNPIAASAVLTLAFAALLIASGIFRIVLASRFWAQAGWVLLLSGLIGIAAGIIIFLAWPVSGLWVLGLCVGIDILFHGIWWLTYAWQVRTAH